MDYMLEILSKLPAYLIFSIQLISIIVISFMVRWFWRNVLIRIAIKTPSTLDQRLFEATEGAAQLTFIALGLSFSWNLYGRGILHYLEVIPWINADSIHSLIQHINFLFLTFSLFYLAWQALSAIILWYETDIAKRTESTLDEKIAFSLRKVSKTFFVLFFIMVLADHFNLPLSKLWAAAGIGSVAIAFAAKDTLANIISGIIILIDRPFLVGDRVELADGTFGDVIDIGLRSTRILSFDNTIYIIPNAEISNQRITNHTYPDIKIKSTHTIGVAYTSDVEKVKCVINDILAKHPRILKDQPWGIWFTEFDDSSLKLVIRYWIADYRDQFTIKDEINTEIKQRFEEEHIEIPFPQREVHIRQVSQDTSHE
jgi:MscS family membrane protein